MRFLARFISLLFLVGAIMTGILDSIQSVATSQVELTTLGATVFSLGPSPYIWLESVSNRNFPAFVWDPVITTLLMQPAVAVFLAASLLFWMLGYKRAPAAGRFAA